MGRFEAPHVAAARELHEELGLVIRPAELRLLGVVRRGFRGAPDRDLLFELRLDALPPVRVDNRELVWAGALSSTGAAWRDLQLPVRWYLRRHGPMDIAERW